MKTRLFLALFLCFALLNSSFTQAGAGAGPILEPEVGWSVPSPASSTASLPPLQNISAITTSKSHTCALTAEGGVQCWSDNGYGQLGDGTKTERTMPVGVSGLGGGVASVSAGGHHTCAVTMGGGVKCWGYNSSGQLGDSMTTDRTTPVAVIGLGSGVATVAAGGYHTCALTTGGGVKCWGDNSHRQLGDGTATIEQRTPVDVIGLGSGVAVITADGYHTCALTTGGGVKCWGSNGDGQLGDGTTSNRSTPVDVSGLESGVISIVAGWYHTCALTTGGGVKCWGNNEYGQLGDGTTTSSSVPVEVNNLGSGVMAITAGTSHTCALTTGGEVQCWGNNQFGRLGDGTEINHNTPVVVSGLGSEVMGIAAGEVHTCALTTGGGVKCWGNNRHGQLGDGTKFRHSLPVVVIGLESGTAAVASGGAHACVLTTGGGARCWGDNQVGQLGDGTEADRSTSVEVSGLENGVAAITAGISHTCALTTDGGAKCWGYNGIGQLGDGTTTNHSTPVDVIGLDSGVVAIAAGEYHTCALTISGGVWCWGRNGSGQLGDSTTTDQNTPVGVFGLDSGVVTITASANHTCALTTDNGVKCWGANDFGQLGDGTKIDRSRPVAVSGLGSGVAAIAAGWNHTCALTTGGGVQCWGNNVSGQLGDGTTADHSTPEAVIGLGIGVTTIAAGTWHTCALTASSGVKCWGSNWYGELGDGTTIERSTPVDVVWAESGAAVISCGWAFTCALTTDGGVQCWGNNRDGQLGNGANLQSSTPVDVVTLMKSFFLPLIFRN